MQDPIEQLTTVVLPKLILKMKELKEQNMKLREDFEQMSKDFADVMADHHQYIRNIERSLNERLEQAKSKRTRKKKADAPAETPVEDTPAAPAPVKPRVTGTDILYANYALCACKGNVAEARMCDPSIDAETYEYIAGLSTAMVHDICDIYPPESDGTVDMKYASANWKEIK